MVRAGASLKEVKTSKLCKIVKINIEKNYSAIFLCRGEDVFGVFVFTGLDYWTGLLD